MTVSDASIAGRAYLQRRPITVDDIANQTEFSEARRNWELNSGLARSQVSVPLLLKEVPLGVLNLGRVDVQPFTEEQIALLETFADQAVIAIENARLFSELEQRNQALAEALGQQTATAEVLRVIASSPSDIDRVLQSITDAAARLCDAPSAILRQLRERDRSLPARAHYFASATFRGLALTEGDFDERPGLPATATSVAGRAYVEGQTIHVHDVAEEAQTRYASAQTYQARHGQRTVVSVPLRRLGEPIGVLSLQRFEVHPFTEQQIALLETFADQAVIAIENARLFTELRDRVEELQALGEVGEAVSSSLDLQEVLTTIVAHATRLAQAEGGTIFELDEATGEFVHRASHGLLEALVAAMERNRPRLDSETVAGRAARSGAAVQMPDIADEPDAASPATLERLREAGFRALVFVPLVRDQRVVGLLVIRRKAPGAFPQSVVDLLQTLASQSVLAIENARLFEQVQETSRALSTCP